MSQCFDENGNYTPGIHDFTLEKFEELFICPFKTSQSREVIFVKAKEWLYNLITDIDSIEEVWLDGSFLTTKTNPNDLDIVFFLNTDLIESDNIETLAKKLQHHTENAPQYHCDAYCSSPGDINKRNYWRGQFGFDREDKPKGIACIKIDSLRKTLIGGESE